MREFLSTFFFFYRHEVKDGRFSVNQSQNKFEIVKLKCNELSLKADDCEKRKKQTNKQRVYGLSYPLPPKYLLVFYWKYFAHLFLPKMLKLEQVLRGQFVISLVNCTLASLRCH